jgi:hypothetical protein
MIKIGPIQNQRAIAQKQEWMERKGTPHFLVQESDKSLKNQVI